MSNLNSPHYFTTKQLAARFNVSLETIKRRRREGLLPFYKFGRSARISLEDVEAYERMSRVSSQSTEKKEEA